MIKAALPLRLFPRRAEWTVRLDIVSFLLIAAIIGLIPAAIAHSKGHSFFSWWFFGAMLWIVAMPCAIMLKRTVNTSLERVCPHCRSFIDKEATVCRYCQRESAVEGIMPEPVGQCSASNHDWVQSELYVDWLKCANRGCKEMKLVGRDKIKSSNVAR
jgi:hypothetical protein